MRTVNEAAWGVAFGAVLAFCGTWAQGATPPTVDGTFVADAASGGIEEVKLGQLAQQKAYNSAVKDFGKRMEMDHSKAADQLKDVASRNKIELPSEMNYDGNATYERLAALSGKDFDKEYAKDMVKDHEKAVAEFKKEASSGSNTDLKNFASQSLPMLESHLQAAREMEKTVENE